MLIMNLKTKTSAGGKQVCGTADDQAKKVLRFFCNEIMPGGN